MYRRYFQATAPGDEHLLSAWMLNNGTSTAEAGSKCRSRWQSLVAPATAFLLGTAVLGGCVVTEHTYGEHGGEEESGNLLTLEETYDVVRGGARLIL